MNNKLKTEAVDQLFDAILTLENKEECYNFFEDLCTVNELLALSQRFSVARMLKEKKTYLEIAEKTGASTATISRVNHSLNYGSDGYELIFKRLDEKNVELRGCEKTVAILGSSVVPADESDWETEYGDFILAVKVVSSFDEAVSHIAKYSSGHSECIITEDYKAAKRFTEVVDAAAVYVNASTRFTDGGMFGLGAEIGISTQKLHARGPMGLNELTSMKFIIEGEGQIRV